MDKNKILNIARKFNCFYFNGFARNECRPFVVAGQQVGLVRADVFQQLLNYPEIFLIRECNQGQRIEQIVELNPAYRDYTERSVLIDKLLRELRSKGLFMEALKGWRDECYEVRRGNEQPLLKMDRSATCLFGIRNYGVSINGFITHPDKGLCIWLQQRAPSKQTWPNKWDNMVSGGLSVGFGIQETAIKEAEEEASIPLNISKNIVSAGCVSFFFESERGLFPNTEYVYDLELPLDFIPFNADGEVQGFELLPAKECLERVFSPEFKTTSAPVIIDFLIRHGFITPENEENFTEVVELLHLPLSKLFNYRQSTTKKIENGQNN